MRIKSSQITYRDVIRSESFSKGRNWRSPKTGHSLVVVGASGDADDPARGQQMFVEESRVTFGWQDFPELESLFPKYELLRSLGPQGAYDPAEKLICIPADASLDVDLLGYGPDEWFPDMVSGAEIDAALRASKGWKPLLWPRPENMSFIPNLQVGQVIRSEQFVRARHIRQSGGEIMYLYHQSADPLRDDPERAKALYRVESVTLREAWTDLGDYYRCQVRCRRIDGGLFLDPREEILEFEQQMDTKDDVPGRSFKAVEVIEGS